MTMNPLPPQAYTKDIMLKAYQWLMVQNASIKEMATTPDILVSLYLKATRDGDHALERPSIQNFKNELKSLAGMMGELDRPANKSVAAPATPVQAAAPAAATPTPAVAPVLAAAPQIPQQVIEEKTASAPSTTSTALESLDCASLLMIQEVKEEFNLSSDLEALRMLIKIGYSRSRNLLK